MGKMSSEVIDLVAKDGKYSTDPATQKGQDLTISPLRTRKQDGIEYLTLEQIRPILDAMPEGRDKLFIRTLWMTGVRITECINIEKQHLRPEMGQIRIRWLKSRKYHEREIPCPPRLMDLLLMYAQRLKHDEKLFDFSRQRGEQITKQHYGVSPHVFRHSFAMNYLRWRKDANAVLELQRLLGHKRLANTLVYLHMSNAGLHEAISEVNY